MERPQEIYNFLPNPFALLRRQKTYPTETLFFKEHKNTVLSLRKFDLERDLGVFVQWQNQDYVSRFWEMAWSREELREHIQGLLNSAYQLPLIYEVDGRAAGFFEVYWAFEDRISPYCHAEMYDRGFHMLIGEKELLKTSFVLESINLVSDFIFKDDERTKNIWAEPRSDNTKIIKVGEKLPGWRFVREFDFPHKRAALLRNSRDLFYREFDLWGN